LGLLHEHQQPAAGIQWNRAVIVADASAWWGWTEAVVDQNIIDQVSETYTKHTEFDPNSIMIYPIDPRWTLDGYGISHNLVLSDLDRAFLGKIYPF